MRYAGQNYEREVPLPPGPFTAEVAEHTVANFGRTHDDFYGFSLKDEPVEFVNLRVSAIGPTELQITLQLPATPSLEPAAWRPVSFRGQGYLETPVYRRAALGTRFTVAGPAIIEEPDATTVVYPGDTLLVRPDGLLDLRVG